MAKWNKMYLFTTENIKGYMEKIDLTNKSVLCVASSFDHALNALLKGAKKVKTFDINNDALYYLELKVEAIKKLTFKEFCDFLLYESKLTLNYATFLKLDLKQEVKTFWENLYKEFSYDGLSLRNSNYFDTKYYDIEDKKQFNLYLKEDEFNKLKTILENKNIEFINSDLKYLEVNDKYDYAFLSNISDYLKLMYESDYLENFKKKIDELKENIDVIYMSYIYDVNSKTKRSEIDDILEVSSIFEGAYVEVFDSCLVGRNKDTKDGIIIY